MMRILLWDIDGTLMHSARNGSYKDYTIPVLEEIFGTSGRLSDMRVSGMTDLQIIFEALSDSDVSQEQIVAQIDLLSRRITEEARRVTGNSVQFFKLLPGVRETLQALHDHPREDHRLRLEHVGAITDEQLQRAHDLGVTCSIFVDQIHYWGDVIVDGLFGPEHGNRWMPCGSAVATGMRISLHNDPPVTPEEPLRNISVAATRMAPSGRVLAPEERLTVDQAIRAQTIDAAWQLFSDDAIGSLEVGKYTDLVVLSADPRSVPAEQVADLEVRATFLAGKPVYAKD